MLVDSAPEMKQPLQARVEPEPSPQPSTLRSRFFARAEAIWARASVPIVFTTFVLLRSIDRVFYKRVVDRMENYTVFFASFLVNVGTQVMTIFLALAYVAWMRCYCKDSRYTVRRFFSWSSPLACNRGQFPQYVLFVCSAAQQIGNVLTSLPTAYLDMTSIGLLLNFTLIFTIFFAVVYLGTKFHRAHYTACVLIVLSSICSMTVELQTGKLGQYKDANGVAQTASTFWYIIFIVGTVPMGFANVYNQKYLQETDLDVVWSSYWGGWWQFLAGFLFFPVNWIPLPAPAAYQAPADTLTYIWHGIQCTMGIAPTAAAGDAVCAAAGGSAAVWFGAYLLCTTSFNVLLCWLTKYMSATWATIGSVLCLDLSVMLATSPLLMGAEAKPIKVEQALGLILAGVAMYVYNFTQEDTPTSVVTLPGQKNTEHPEEIFDIEGRVSAVARARADSNLSRTRARADSNLSLGAKSDRLLKDAASPLKAEQP